MWLTALFEAIKAGFSFGTKAIPSDKMREETQQIRKPRLTLKERDKILSESIVYLDLHPALQAENYCAWKFDSLDADDIADITKILTEKYSKRKQRSLKYHKP